MIKFKLAPTEPTASQMHTAYSLEIKHTCSACYFSGAQPDCEFCQGKIHYTQKHYIPLLDTAKIYKDMLKPCQDAPDNESTTQKLIEEACESADTITELREQVDRYRSALDMLKIAKEYKDTFGKDATYETMRELAWQHAYEIPGAKDEQH